MAFDPFQIRPGTFNSFITITSPSTTDDEWGQPIATWNTVWTCRAGIFSTLTATYKTAVTQDAISSQAPYIITMRWPGSNVVITPDMRVTCGTKTYLINAIDNVWEKNRILRLFCMVIDGTSL